MPILKPTGAVMTELLTAIKSAKKEILLQIFYIDNDATTSLFLDALIQKSLDGIKVYCLIDALGGISFGTNTILQKLKDSGVHIEYFNWLTPWKGRSKKWWYFRNHKRSLIIDGLSVHLGGWCIGVRTAEWLECHIENGDPEVIRDASLDFWNMYKYAHKTQVKFLHQNKYAYSGKRFSYTHQAPLLKSRYIYYTHKKLIQQTSKRIILVTPYFTPIPGLLQQLIKARKRNVCVEIFLPKNTDHTIVDLVAHTYMQELLDVGVEIYRSDTMIHAKANLFDDTLYIGTMNLDTISLRYNFENGIFVHDEDIVTDFDRDILKLKTTCTLLTLAEWKKRSIWAKFLDSIMKLWRPFV